MRIPALTALLVCIAMAVGAAAAIASEGSGPGFPGARPPSMILAEPEGPKHDISKSKNGTGPVAIYFWSVFCSNCKEAMPLLLELDARWSAKGLTIWAVNVDGDRFSNAVVSFLKTANLPFTAVYDRLEGDMLVAADPLAVSKTPTLIILDRGGEIKLRQEIAVDLPAVEKTVSELLR